MNRIELKYLVGVNVMGRKAITTNPMYYYQYPAGVPVRELIDVKVSMRKDNQENKYFKWYTVRWVRQPSDNCDFSGYREDSTTPVTVEFLDGAHQATVLP